MIRALLAASILSLALAACETGAPVTDGEGGAALSTTPPKPKLTQLSKLAKEYETLAENAAGNAARLAAIGKETSESAVAERDRAMTASWRALSARSYWAAGEDGKAEGEAGLGWIVCRDLIAAGDVKPDTARDCAFLASVGGLARARRAADAMPAAPADPLNADLTMAQWENVKDAVGTYERQVSEGWTQSAGDMASVPNAPAEVVQLDVAAKTRLWCRFAAKASTLPLWRAAEEDSDAAVKTATVRSYYGAAMSAAAAVSLKKPAQCEAGPSAECERATEAALNAECRS